MITIELFDHFQQRVDRVVIALGERMIDGLYGQGQPLHLQRT